MIVTARAPVRIDFAGGWTDVDLFARGAGGVVVNATINKYVTGKLARLETGAGAAAREGLEVSYGFDLPSGSGLGTSSALNVVWLALIKSQIVTGEDRTQIAELAYQLEAMLGILGGKQDQYAAAHGGFNRMTFGEGRVEVEKLDITPDTIRQIEMRAVLCYTGKPRLSGRVHESVWGAFRRGNAATVEALYGLRAVALRMKPVVLAGDVDAFAQLLAENWQHQKALDASVTNETMERLFGVARDAGARGGKACGAGGGGCLFFVAEAGRREAIAGALADAGARIIPFAFEHDGLTVSLEE